ncbi:PadR family transcriptional regulator [Actinomadura sp. DC4]|uniref:PadR family transcriptional regulator n=1 Tax=Actinomadura sp. DC4 TaxID=3055069 RepID=UPI0025AEFA7D|nr:PadR family transcriptional regulator [Actinomadura sp. DC4]MDN3352011.1 PadR family transcriptional regulator [Actinomadura sp. DC4]
MALRHAVLAALLEGEASGYQLAKRFDVSVANFWSATPQQLYRELERLERDGLLSGRVVEQRRRPNKRVFTLTADGREELHAFTARPARPTAMRDDLLVKLQAVDAGDQDAVRKALTVRLERSRGRLDLYDRLRDGLLDGRDEAAYLSEADRVGPYLTLMAGRAYEQENIRWSETVLGILDRRAAARR